MQVDVLSYTKSDLMQIPQTDREWLVAFALMNTEVNTLLSCVLMSYPPTDMKEPTFKKAQINQALHLSLILGGKLLECWNTVQHHFLECPLRPQLEKHVSGDAQVSYEWLKSYFGRKDNTLRIVRNKLGFHYDFARIAAGFNAVPDNAPLEMCVSTHAGGTRHLWAGLVAANSVDLRRFMKDVTGVAKHLSRFMDGYITSVVRRYLPLASQPLEVSDAVHPFIPAFCDLGRTEAKDTSDAT